MSAIVDIEPVVQSFHLFSLNTAFQRSMSSLVLAILLASVCVVGLTSCSVAEGWFFKLWFINTVY